MGLIDIYRYVIDVLQPAAVRRLYSLLDIVIIHIQVDPPIPALPSFYGGSLWGSRKQHIQN
jgi:hypothetical protein